MVHDFQGGKKKCTLYVPLIRQHAHRAAGVPHTCQEIIQMLTILHIWCIYYICADLGGILTVGVDHVYIKVGA